MWHGSPAPQSSRSSAVRSSPTPPRGHRLRVAAENSRELGARYPLGRSDQAHEWNDHCAPAPSRRTEDLHARPTHPSASSERSTPRNNTPAPRPATGVPTPAASTSPIMIPRTLENAAMTLNRVQALRTQRQVVLDYCAGFTDDEWTAPSQAAAWRVRDVIAHLGGTCRGLFNQHAITLVFSDDTEQTNEDLLAPRRTRPTDRVLAEFAHSSKAC